VVGFGSPRQARLKNKLRISTFVLGASCREQRTSSSRPVQCAGCGLSQEGEASRSGVSPQSVGVGIGHGRDLRQRGLLPWCNGSRCFFPARRGARPSIVGRSSMVVRTGRWAQRRVLRKESGGCRRPITGKRCPPDAPSLEMQDHRDPPGVWMQSCIPANGLWQSAAASISKRTFASQPMGPHPRVPLALENEAIEC